MLEQAIYNTIRYFDLLDLPLTVVQVWQYLLVDESESNLRWEGHARYSLAEVRATLQTSPWLAQRLESKWGYYVLAGRQPLVRRRLTRHALAQDKWKLLVTAARWLAAVPFVRALAGSGSLALDNARPSSDLDLLIIVHPHRIWTARLGLLVVSQLLGRRRKYWNREAPDKLCLNHYLADNQLLLSVDIRNVYTAVMYAVLVPVYNPGGVKNFLQRNDVWMRRYVMTQEFPAAGHNYTIKLPAALSFIKRQIEAILLEFIGDGLEYLARRVQLGLIRRHYHPRQAGRVVVSAHELAFHPDTKMTAILSRFGQDPGQQPLL